MQSERIKSKKRVKHYEFLYDSKIGSGAYANVYMGRDIYNDSTVAIKIISNNLIKSDYTSQQIKREVEIMKSLNHQNIVKLLDVFHSTNNIYIVTEYCNGGDLKTYLGSRTLSEERALQIFKQILNGLQELLRNGIVHRDLKPANILLQDGIFKITDFGFAKRVQMDSTMSSLVGTPLYMAPQILKRQPYTSKSDIWSLGLVLYEMIYKITPWHSTNVVELLNRLDKEPLKFPFQPQIELLTRQIIIGCLGKEEKDRWGWDQLMKAIQGNEKQQLMNIYMTKELYYVTKKQQMHKQQSQQDLQEYCRTSSTQSSPIRSISTKRQKTITNENNSSVLLSELIKKKQQIYKIFELLEKQLEKLPILKLDQCKQYLQEQRSRLVCANIEQIYNKEDERELIQQQKILQQYSSNFGIQIMILLLKSYRKIIINNYQTGTLNLDYADKQTIENCTVLVSNQYK
ncbi:unnamed protein product [Paramecium primaurelia]|uniref:Protein kinase domain-containing protein n=1 Tax=Paramecium primaurelia TaxID=5886 RepID=A0A8S1PPW3_PARPR|nr:unnamed protein product [Paramecium primaurelia]